MTKVTSVISQKGVLGSVVQKVVSSVIVEGGQSWSSYWTTLISATVEDAAPTNVVLTFSKANTSLVASDFTIAGFTISSLSRDVTNKILTLTLTVEVISDDALVITFGKTGQTSNVTNNVVVWYLAGGINPSAVVGAYKFAGVTSEAASLVNLVSPGTDDLLKVSTPVWNKTLGWGGFSQTKYLTGPTYKTKTYSVTIGVEQCANTGYGRAFSCERDISGSYDTFIMPNTAANNVVIRQANEYYLGTGMSKGVFGATQSKFFIDGQSVGSLTPSGTERSEACRIGQESQNTANVWLPGYVTGLAIYNTSITDAQMIAVQNKMKSDRFKVASIRDFSQLARYANNPVNIHNTNEWNTYGSDSPYLRVANKIGDKYYAQSQASTSFGVWNNLVTYESTDLVNWNTSSVNPAVSKTTDAWDHGYLMHPSVIKIDATYYMYYGAKNSAGKRQIGLATSSDLLNWTKYGSSPVLTTTAGCDLPSVIKIGSTYYMYFWEVGTVNVGTVKYATSSDGITWTVGEFCFKIYVSDWFYGKIVFDPWVHQRSDGMYEMVYTAALAIPTIYQEIGYAISYDGIYWFVKQGAILSKNGTGWEAGYVGDGVLFENPLTGKTNMFYAGMDNDTGTSEHSDGGLVIF